MNVGLVPDLLPQLSRPGSVLRVMGPAVLIRRLRGWVSAAGMFVGVMSGRGCGSCAPQPRPVSDPVVHPGLLHTLVIGPEPVAVHTAAARAQALITIDGDDGDGNGHGVGAGPLAAGVSGRGSVVIGGWVREAAQTAVPGSQIGIMERGQPHDRLTPPYVQAAPLSLPRRYA